jgi:3-phosphoglycerate kinase
MMAGDCVGPAVEGLAARMQEGDVLLLENPRFHAGEEQNDPSFARQLARLANVYVNDAFGTAHRAHASTAGITRFVSTAVAGLLMQAELEHLGKLLTAPARPCIATFTQAISAAHTIVWNGPLGVCEIEAFAKGTRAIARAVAPARAATIVGGGDTVAAVNQAGVAERLTHLSTGGGAFLELLEGRELPRITALMDQPTTASHG